MAEPILTVDHLVKSYDGHTNILENVSFAVKPGEVIVVVGPSGCGKSTLLRCLNGLEPVQSGRVQLGGETVAYGGKNLQALRQRIGMVFQSYELFPHLTVLDNILLAPTKVQKRPKAEVQKEAEALLDRVGLLQKAKSYPRELSGGQKQRVAIAGVVAMRPDCLILDEATAMLDPRGREQVMQTIHHLNQDMGITVVAITHYMEEAAQADRVLVMSKGNVVMEGTPKEVFSQTEKVRALRLDVPQAAELRDELVKAGIPMPEGIIDTGECAQALYELLQ